MCFRTRCRARCLSATRSASSRARRRSTSSARSKRRSALTNTLSVGAVMDGLVRWTLDQSGNDSVRSVNALVGETNDGGLNDIRGQHVRPQHVLDALKSATTGAGPGGQRRRRHWNAGVRLEGRHRHLVAQARRALRRLYRRRARAVELRRRADDGRRAGREDPRTLFVQANRPTGQRANRKRRSRRWLVHDRRRDRCAARRARLETARRPRGLRAGAHRIVVQQRQRRVCDRVLDRRGSADTSSARQRPQPRTLLPTDGVSPLFQAALEATEEAVYNSLLKATTVTSRSARQKRSRSIG